MAIITSDKMDVLINDNLYVAMQASRVVARRWKFDRDELLSIALGELWKAAMTFDASKGKFSRYAYRAIIWRCSQYCRRQRVTQTLSSVSKLSVEWAMIHSTKKHDNTSDIEALHAAVEKVEPARSKQFLELALMGTKTGRIAKELGCSVRTVKDVRDRAIVAVRKLIEVE